MIFKKKTGSDKWNLPPCGGGDSMKGPCADEVRYETGQSDSLIIPVDRMMKRNSFDVWRVIIVRIVEKIPHVLDEVKK